MVSKRFLTQQRLSRTTSRLETSAPGTGPSYPPDSLRGRNHCPRVRRAVEWVRQFMRSSPCVIFNPTARGNRARHFRAFLDRLTNCELRPTTGPGDARFLAARAAVDGFAVIVAAGGDGTVNEVVNGLGDVEGALARCRLGIIPLGTVNVLARELGIPTTIDRAWPTVQQGRTRWLDLPEVTCETRRGRERRYFVQMAGAGLDARAVELTDWKFKQRFGPLAYVRAGFQALAERQRTIHAVTGTGAVTGELVVASNGRLYGGNFPLFPQADPADGLLDVCSFPKVSLPRLPWIAAALLAGRIDRSRLTRHWQTRELRLECDQSCPLQIDGDLLGHLPAEICVRQRVRVVVP